MRKVISILFIAVLFASQLGYYFVYIFQQHQIKEAVKKQLLSSIPASSLELIVAGQNPSFRWEEAGKEFSQNGQLYDVVRSVIKNGATILYCLSDTKEKDLLLHLGKAVKAATGKAGKQSIQTPVIDLMVQDIYCIVAVHPFIPQQYPAFDAAVIAFSKKVNAPPPRA